MQKARLIIVTSLVAVAVVLAVRRGAQETISPVRDSEEARLPLAHVGTTGGAASLQPAQDAIWASPVTTAVLQAPTAKPAFVTAARAPSRMTVPDWEAVPVMDGIDPAFGTPRQMNALQDALRLSLRSYIDDCKRDWNPPLLGKAPDGEPRAAILEGDFILNLESSASGYTLVTASAEENKRTRWADDNLLACMTRAFAGRLIEDHDMPEAMTRERRRARLRFPYRFISRPQ